MTDQLNRFINVRFGESIEIDEDLKLTDILGHRVHRSYKSDAIDNNLLRCLFAAALSAPSKSDLQQADIIQVKDPGKRQQIEALIPEMPWISEAPVFLVFCGNSRRIRQICEWRGKPFANDHLDAFFNAAIDTGLVLMNFIRAAEAVGLGCCPISVIRNHVEVVSELLKLPDYVFPVAGLCVGYPAKSSYISPRLSLDVTTHTDEFDDTRLQQQVDEYDRRRDAIHSFIKQRYLDDYGEAEFYGWSEDKARQVSKSERADFGTFIRKQQFKLD